MQAFLQSINRSRIKVNKCQNLHSGKKKKHLAAFLQISIYEPFNILSDKMLIVPLGIWDTVTRNEMPCPFRCGNQLG